MIPSIAVNLTSTNFIIFITHFETFFIDVLHNDYKRLVSYYLCNCFSSYSFDILLIPMIETPLEPPLQNMEIVDAANPILPTNRKKPKILWEK